MSSSPKRDVSAGSPRGGVTFRGPDASSAVPSSAAASLRMSRTSRRDTAPELLLRRALHRRGLRFRVDKAVLPDRRRRADIVFGRARVVVFVDGCFWHGCPVHGTSPSANARFWHEKIETNQRRDRDTDERLKHAGWHVVRIWEHEDPVDGAERIDRLVRGRHATATGERSTS